MNTIVLCTGSSCFARGNKDLLKFIQDFLKKNNIEKSTEFKGKLCAGLCNKGPIIEINGKIYEYADQMSIQHVLETTLLSKK